jgi:hypothetical protein
MAPSRPEAVRCAAMIPLRAALLAPVLAIGCATPPPPPKAKLVVPDAAEPTRSHKVAMPRVPPAERPSELGSVTDDQPDPEAKREFQARMAQAPVPLVATPSPPRVTATALDDTRRGEAPGMARAGDVYAATLAEGQRASTKVRVGPGECATFIAQGGIGVIEVDLFLTRGEGAASEILAQDPATGPIAVIGGHGRCLTGAPGTGSEATLNAVVRRGAGVVLVGAYKK